MRRVYVTWFIRKATPAAGELAGFALLTNWGLNYVSPADIVINSFSAAGSTQAFIIFYVRAFLHLSGPSQFALIAGTVFGAIVMRDVWIQVNRLIALRQKLILSS